MNETIMIKKYNRLEELLNNVIFKLLTSNKAPILLFIQNYTDFSYFLKHFSELREEARFYEKLGVSKIEIEEFFNISVPFAKGNFQSIEHFRMIDSEIEDRYYRIIAFLMHYKRMLSGNF